MASMHSEGCDSIDSVNITSLPEDCLRLVCEIVNDASLVSLTQTCKGLQAVADEPEQWKRRAALKVHGSGASEAFIEGCSSSVEPKVLYLGLIREHGHLLTSLWRALDAPYGALIVPRLTVDDGNGLPCIDLLSIIVHKLKGKVQGRRVFRIPLLHIPYLSEQAGLQKAEEQGSWIPRIVRSTVTSLQKLAMPSSSSSEAAKDNEAEDMDRCLCFNHPESHVSHPIHHSCHMNMVLANGRNLLAMRCKKRSCRHTDFEPMLRYTGYFSEEMKGSSPLIDLPSLASESFDSLGLEVEEPDEMELRAHFRHITRFLHFLDVSNQKKPHHDLPASQPDNQDGKTIYYERLDVGTGHLLAGLWRGTYSSHGLEIVNMTYRPRGEDLPWPEFHPESDPVEPSFTLVATKITGDSNVPAGQISIIVDLSQTHQPRLFRPNQKFKLDEGFFCDLSSESLGNLTIAHAYDAKGHIAMSNFENDSWSNATLVTFKDSPDVMGLVWHDLRSFSLFSRLQIQI
jgi:hypothetical protein